MKLAMHNWMRPEPIEVTIERLGRLGYDAIEISGEPATYDVGQVKELLAKHNVACWGSVTLMTEGRDLIHEDKYVRLGTIQYIKDIIAMIEALDGADLLHRALHGRQDQGHGRSRHGMGLGRGGPQGDLLLSPASTTCASALSRSTASRPTSSTAPIRACSWPNEVGNNVGVTLDTFHLNIEEADMLASIRNAGSQARGLPCRRQQPHAARQRRHRLQGGDRDAALDRLRRLRHLRVRDADRPHAAGRARAARQGQGAEEAGTARAWRSSCATTAPACSPPRSTTTWCGRPREHYPRRLLLGAVSGHGGARGRWSRPSR